MGDKSEATWHGDALLVEAIDPSGLRANEVKRLRTARDSWIRIAQERDDAARNAQALIARALEALSIDERSKERDPLYRERDTTRAALAAIDDEERA